MDLKLIKIAKEFNLGTTSIVEFLTKVGFEIENKPTSKLSEEMYKSLLKEFQPSRDIKQQASELNIGNRPNTPTAKVEIKKEHPAEEPKAEQVAPKKEEHITTHEAPKLRILGKINLQEIGNKGRILEKEYKQTHKEQETPVAPVLVPEKVAGKEETPVQEEAPVKAKEEIKQPEKVQEAVVVEEDAVLIDNNDFQTSIPQLKGLKILGKIDTDKFKKKKKKGKGDEPLAPIVVSKLPIEKQELATVSLDSLGAERRKRKRKRKKITQTDPKAAPTAAAAPETKNAPRHRKDDKELPSQKEIDDQVRATMAKMSASGKNRRQKIRRDQRVLKREKQELHDAEMLNSKIQLTEFISVSELANLMDVSPTQVITTCMNLGYFVNLNQRLDAELIEIVASEFGYEVEFISAEEQLDIEEEEDTEVDVNLEPRAPIVTVMGHVDHGKTSLLDHIRKANVAGGEAGGITQHIGAYEVKLGDKKITFLDTPGHEAFTAMRARGAKVTDIAIIIIAADDSIMPQTREAISHAQAANVPMVFAINKVDKEGAQPERIKQLLAEMNILVEDWGGTYQSQDISAKKGTGVDELLEKILIQAEMLELKANPNKKAQGVVLEASLDKGRGYVTKTLIQNGSLHVGDVIVAGEHAGKVKAMFNELGKKVSVAGPASPVLILGLTGAPQAGEKLKVLEDDQSARQLASKRAQIIREQANRANKRISLEEIGRRLALGTFKELNLIIKGDFDGSVEALSDSLLKLSIDTVQVKIIHKAVGQIVESDVLLASASDAIIIGFHVRPSSNARKLAEKEGVEIKNYSIIYEAINELKAAIEGMLEPTKEEKLTCEIEVREVFKISKVGTIAGCYVKEGKVNRNTLVRVVRNGIIVFPVKEGVIGELTSLKRFKEDVKDVRAGLECGLGIKNFNDIEVEDIIEGYEIVEVKRKL